MNATTSNVLAQTREDNAPFCVHHSIQMIFAEFLRAVAREEPSGKKHLVGNEFWRLIDALGDLSSEHRVAELSSAIGDCLDDCRNSRDGESDLGIARDRVVRKSAKILAERISGQMTQLRRAESAISQELRLWEDAIEQNRARSAHSRFASSR